jgi:hypothetical protein
MKNNPWAGVPWKWQIARIKHYILLVLKIKARCWHWSVHSETQLVANGIEATIKKAKQQAAAHVPR